MAISDMHPVILGRYAAHIRKQFETLALILKGMVISPPKKQDQREAFLFKLEKQWSLPFEYFACQTVIEKKWSS